MADNREDIIFPREHLNTATSSTASINWNTISTAMSSASINPVTVINPLQEKMEQYVEKVEKHVDQLEEDIDFFNNKRMEQDDNIEYLMMENDKKDKTITELQIKIEILEKQITSLTNQLASVYQLHTA